tara:strand:- start:232 stop:600 length:369 start_codon:yes stop_codon:yes gene_type:complete
MQKIVLLKVIDETATTGMVILEYLFWLAVQPGREQPLPEARSTWKDAPNDVALALQKGTVIERQKRRTFPVDLSADESRAMAKRAARITLEKEFDKEQAAEDAKLSPLMFYGITYDGIWSDE